GSTSKRLANATGAPAVLPSGFLLFPRQTTLLAQAFDFKKLELYGSPFQVADSYSSGLSATSGIVAYKTTSRGDTRQLTWLDRSGKTLGSIGAPSAAGQAQVELSPDGKRVAVRRSADIWLIDTGRGIPTRLTFDEAIDAIPIWSSDGSRVAFQSSRTG